MTTTAASPFLSDAVAAEREIIVFDDIGTGASTGTTPATIQGSPTARFSSSRRLG